ncbi:hypothetical protein [Pseudoxanthomonas sp.]|uniref:hypothetical protein n=1 Tax=Pseudoxanthomonas sp. TaxID=1871049 RepID=UPI003F80070A
MFLRSGGLGVEAAETAGLDGVCEQAASGSCDATAIEATPMSSARRSASMADGVAGFIGILRV